MVLKKKIQNLMSFSMASFGEMTSNDRFLQLSETTEACPTLFPAPMNSDQECLVKNPPYSHSYGSAVSSVMYFAPVCTAER